MYVSQARGGFNRQIRCFTRVDNQSLHPFSHLSVYYSIEPSKSKINLKNSRRVTWKCVQSLNVHAMKIFLILHCVQKPIYDEHTVEFMTLTYIRILFGNFPRIH